MVGLKCRYKNYFGLRLHSRARTRNAQEFTRPTLFIIIIIFNIKGSETETINSKCREWLDRHIYPAGPATLLLEWSHLEVGVVRYFVVRKNPQ